MASVSSLHHLHESGELMTVTVEHFNPYTDRFTEAFLTLSSSDTLIVTGKLSDTRVSEHLVTKIYPRDRWERVVVS